MWLSDHWSSILWQYFISRYLSWIYALLSLLLVLPSEQRKRQNDGTFTCVAEKSTVCCNTLTLISNYVVSPTCFPGHHELGRVRWSTPWENVWRLLKQDFYRLDVLPGANIATASKHCSHTVNFTENVSNWDDLTICVLPATWLELCGHIV